MLVLLRMKDTGGSENNRAGLPDGEGSSVDGNCCEKAIGQGNVNR